MNAPGLDLQFGAYSDWRKRLSETVDALRKWLVSQNVSDLEIEQRLDHTLSTLRDDKLYIAFVAEFSRGKSELINAIFFSQFGCRVLPSSAGRTTMCPTELMHESGTAAGLRLLPIETRASGTTVTELRSFPEEWKAFPLDTNSPESMIAALQHITETKLVDYEVARSFGLHVAENETESGSRRTEDGKVEIPRWRHAIIELPHPLLDQGLVILDTPGLNALGSEPELTLNLLPSAHAVLFILAADAGVTKSDIQVWHDHIGSQREVGARGRLVVLNKIDGLWDELRDQDQIDREIERQIRETSRTLNVTEKNIFAVSAQKALTARVKNDSALLERSRIQGLEGALAREVLPAKREIVRDNVSGDIRYVLDSVRAVLKQRHDGAREHLEEIAGLSGRNKDVVEHMMNKVKADKEVFEKSLQRFQATRSIFAQQTNVLYSRLNLKNLETVIAEVKRDMTVSMTTSGLKSSMENFFRITRTTMEEAAIQAKEIKEMMDGVYRRFQKEYGLIDVRPTDLSVTRYLREINRIEAKHEQFAKGLSVVFIEQQILTRKFFESSVAKVRAIYRVANRDADQWLKTIMGPMESQVREHQILLRRRLESIKRIHQATDTLDERVAEVEQARDAIRDQEQALAERGAAIVNLLQTPIGREDDASVRAAG